MELWQDFPSSGNLKDSYVGYGNQCSSLGEGQSKRNKIKPLTGGTWVYIIRVNSHLWGW